MRTSNSQPCQGQRRISLRARVLVGAGLGGRDRAGQLAERQAAALVGASVGQGEQLALDVENDDVAPGHMHELALARRDVCGFGDDVTRHAADIPQFPPGALARSVYSLVGSLRLKPAPSKPIPADTRRAHCPPGSACGAPAGGRRERAERVVEVPVRVVGGEQQPVPADPLHGVEQVLAVLAAPPSAGSSPRCARGCTPTACFLRCGTSAAHALEQLVEAPGQRRQPGEAALDHDHLEASGSARTRPR